MSLPLPNMKIDKPTEFWRPQLHFTPHKNWMNDPNGLVFVDGKYHLFFQYNPYGKGWGNMSWGHAESPDLYHWTELPVALEPDKEKLGMVFSGSCVLDTKNTSGFVDPNSHASLVAIFTHHDTQNVQRQSIAYSNDFGNSWQNYLNNPVIDNPGIKDFRDPKVFWYEPLQMWIMVLAAGQNVMLYSSADLKEWQHLSNFGEEYGVHRGEWECPDLFPMKASDGETRWVMLVSINPGAPNGGSGTQYFVGDFDGTQFTSDSKESKWFDYGPDNYAGVSFSGMEEQDRRIVIGWMSNWTYAGELPTDPWCGAMTLPRELSLIHVEGDYFLCNTPASEIDEFFLPLSQNTSDGNIQENLPMGNAHQIIVDIDDLRRRDFSLEWSNSVGENLNLTFLSDRNLIRLDRRHSGWGVKVTNTALVEAPVLAHNVVDTVRIVVDASSIEIFWGDCSTTLTGVYFASEPFTRFTFESDQSFTKTVAIHSYKV